MSTPSIASNKKLQTIPWHHLQVGKQIGQGGFGEVYLGSWNGREVAIKTLKITNLPAYLAKEFESETKIMAECSQCQQIVRLFAVCMEAEHFAMVMEFAKYGSLYAILHEPSIDLSWHRRYQMAMDIGRGLSYLHDREILHRDLKSLNVLLDENFSAKISDFGLSKLKLETSSMSKTSTTQKEGSAVGTLRWQAPELFKLKPRHTKASDAYSYGMVLWEIASRQIPFGEANETVIMNCVKEGEKEEIPEDCPAEYAGLIERTWSLDPEKRPSPHYIVLQLEKLIPKSKVNPAPSIATSAIRDPGKIAASVKHNPSIRPHQSSAPVKPPASKIPDMAFGKAKWEKHFGDVGIEPPLPPDLEQILNAPCPFWPGKKVRETHLLTLIPQTVNGQPLTLKSLGELVKTPKQGHSTKYGVFFLEEYTDPSAPAAHWALLTRDVIPGSRNKPYADQQALVASYAQKTRLPYQVPTILDAAVSIFMEHVQSGVFLYSNNPWTYTRCQEKANASWQLVVGDFAPFGLGVTYYFNDDGHGECGVGSLRKF
jgi:serine/threonine protein kinase